jgi:hypothetical protein
MTKRTIAIIGLGKMGGNLALQAIEKGYSVTGFSRSCKPHIVASREKENIWAKVSLSVINKTGMKGRFTMYIIRIIRSKPNRSFGNIFRTGLSFHKGSVQATFSMIRNLPRQTY